jgi:hypothetical protein
VRVGEHVGNALDDGLDRGGEIGRQRLAVLQEKGVGVRLGGGAVGGSAGF